MKIEKRTIEASDTANGNEFWCEECCCPFFAGDEVWIPAGSSSLEQVFCNYDCFAEWLEKQQQNAITNAWVDLRSTSQQLVALRGAGTVEENLKSEELITASTETVRELEATFAFLA